MRISDWSSDVCSSDLSSTGDTECEAINADTWAIEAWQRESRSFTKKHLTNIHFARRVPAVATPKRRHPCRTMPCRKAEKGKRLKRQHDLGACLPRLRREGAGIDADRAKAGHVGIREIFCVQQVLRIDFRSEERRVG